MYFTLFIKKYKLYDECRKYNITKIICITLEKKEIENEEEQYIEDKENGKRYKVKTPLQVYNVCKKLKLFKD